MFGGNFFSNFGAAMSESMEKLLESDETSLCEILAEEDVLR
jgi:hypothetical protein